MIQLLAGGREEAKSCTDASSLDLEWEHEAGMCFCLFVHFLITPLQRLSITNLVSSDVLLSNIFSRIFLITSPFISTFTCTREIIFLQYFHEVLYF